MKITTKIFQNMKMKVCKTLAKVGPPDEFKTLCKKYFFRILKIKIPPLQLV
jgi:hypothetical protein